MLFLHGNGWLIHNHWEIGYEIPNQAQINTAFDYTGDNIENE